MTDDEKLQDHLKIADYLMQKMVNDEFRSGEKVPSITQLADKFRVYRTVAERALKRLENLGWLTPVHGKGYFVTKKQKKNSYYFSKFNRYTNSMARIETTPNAQLLDWSLGEATPEEQEYLDLSEVEKVYRLEILRFVGSTPQSVTTSSLPEKMVPGMERYLHDFRSMYGLLEEHYQFTPIRKYSIIETRLPLTSDAMILKIPESMPIFNKINLNLHPNGLPVELDIGRARGDLTRYVIDLETTE